MRLAPLALAVCTSLSLADELDERVTKTMVEANRAPSPAKGDALMGEKKWVDAAKAYLDYLARRPDDAEAWYRLAACLSRAGRGASAANAVSQAFRAGFTDLEKAKGDPDLETLRKSPAWGAAMKLVAEVPKRDWEKVWVEGGTAFEAAVSRPPGHDAKKAAPLVVILHGRGGDAPDFLRSVPDWCASALVAALPAPVVTYDSGCPIGREWVPNGAGGEERRRAEELALEYVARGIEALKKKYAVDPASVTLLGVSQGAGVAMRVALRKPDLLTGLAVVMGATSGVDFSPLKGKRILVAHSREDETTPFAASEQMVAEMQRAGLAPEFFVYPGGHKLVPELIKGAGEWLKGKPLPK
jgi:predicted esterase